jgi:hypothetical protein
MRLLHEIPIVIMEMLGFFLLSAALGVLVDRWLGLAGLLLASGLALLVSAALVTVRQYFMAQPRTKKPDTRP